MHKNTIEHFKDTRSILYNSAMDNVSKLTERTTAGVAP